MKPEVRFWRRIQPVDATVWLNISAGVTRFLLNRVLVKSGGAWRVMSIFPIPAPAP